MDKLGSTSKAKTMNDLRTLVAAQLRMQQHQQGRIDDAVMLIPRLDTRIDNGCGIHEFDIFEEHEIFKLLRIPYSMLRKFLLPSLSIGQPEISVAVVSLDELDLTYFKDAMLCGKLKDVTHPSKMKMEIMDKESLEVVIDSLRQEFHYDLIVMNYSFVKEENARDKLLLFHYADSYVL
ncbi:hypothetical protein Prudu_376S000200, partial [Prunus dulcis]